MLPGTACQRILRSGSGHQLADQEGILQQAGCRRRLTAHLIRIPSNTEGMPFYLAIKLGTKDILWTDI